LSAERIINADCKEYVEEGHRFSVAQIEELSLSRLAGRQAELIVELGKARQARNLVFATLLVTDINTQTSILLVCGAREFLDTIDFPQTADNAFLLDGIVSRKKQLLPYLLRCLHRMKPLRG